MSIPGWIYLAMGLVIARILLEGTQTRGYRPMDWFNLLFNIARIVALWPLVLFVERIEEWLKREPVMQLVEEREPAGAFYEGWQVENVLPIPATGRAEAGD